MNRLSFFKIILHILFLFVGLNAHSQEINIATRTPLNHLSQERIYVTTDRSLYAANEEIKIFAAYLQKPLSDTLVWSKVLYIEIINAQGTSFHQSKHPLNKWNNSIEITIPETLKTGDYFIKAYTRWMRNFSTRFYGYKMIKIINLSLPEVESANINNIDSSECPVFMPCKGGSQIKLVTDKTSYKPREPVKLEIQTGIFNSDNSSFTVSVAKTGATNRSGQKIEWMESPDFQDYPLLYLPEIFGNTISGVVKDPVSGVPVGGIDVAFAIMADTAYFTTTKSTSDGLFYFNLPHYNEDIPFFLIAKDDSTAYEIARHSDFCTKPVSLEPIDFSISDKEEAAWLDIAINAQLKQKYYNDQFILSDMERESLGFYGRPDATYETKDYIEIPTLDEFIFEIISEISIVNQREKAQIYLAKKNTFQVYPLLVMIDHVPVTSLQEILNMKTRDIEKVEVINHAFVAGHSKFNGILHVFSKKGNYGGLMLPTNSMLSQMEGFHVSQHNHEKVSTEGLVENQPDRRTTIYWNTDIKIVPNTKNNYSFFTSDIIGEYEILLYGIKNNMPFCESSTIVVNND